MLPPDDPVGHSFLFRTFPVAASRKSASSRRGGAWKRVPADGTATAGLLGENHAGTTVSPEVKLILAFVASLGLTKPNGRRSSCHKGEAFAVWLGRPAASPERKDETATTANNANSSRSNPLRREALISACIAAVVLGIVIAELNGIFAPIGEKL
jgi:hypothetical protein